MAKQDTPRSGSWLVAEEFYEQGNDAFVAELRLVCDPDRLGNFASRWINDPRPFARHSLRDYLSLPFNAFRHESLLKRLYKLAEKAGDDELMMHFLVGFDRTVRRVRRKKHHYDWSSRQQWTTERIVTPVDTTIPRDRKQLRYRNPNTGELMAAASQKKQAQMRLFSLRTRKYLRLRSWRYLRNLGKTYPDRYVTAAVRALKQYQDADVVDGLALIDNWSLVHILFHHSPVLNCSASGWKLADGKTLGELTPAPAFESLWKQAPKPLIELLLSAECRPVRQWALQLLRRDHPTALSELPLPTLLKMLSHEDDDIALLAAESMRQSSDLASITVEQWLELVESSSPQTLSVIAELMQKHLKPSQLSRQRILALACSRPFPVAQMGFQWLQTMAIQSAGDAQELSVLGKAQADGLRPQMIEWVRSQLTGSQFLQPQLLLDFLDSRHLDVRTSAWNWLICAEQIRQDTGIWQKLLETPYDDIRLQLAKLLEEESHPQQDPAKRSALLRSSRENPELTRMLWATVLLNVNRGGRRKPGVIHQITDRLERHPEEASTLLPILRVALRSLRGPEWRSGLTAAVRIANRHPDLQQLIDQHFPELQLV